MVYAVAILLISSLTTVGLIAVLAATSPGNWFWRTMAFLGAMSPLLLTPAYEPFVAFVIQGAVVAAGVQLARWRRARRSGEPFLKSQFSLKTILLAMVPAALLAAVAVRLPEAKLSFWPNVILIGVVAGVSSLAALWMFRGVWPRMWLRFPLALAVPSLLALTIAWKEWFISNLASFQFEVDRAYWQYYALLKAAYYGLVWAAVFLVATLSTYVGLRLTARVREQGLRLKSILPASILAAIVFLPAATIYHLLVNIDPMPQAELPSPNGYDDFLAAVNTIPRRVTVYSNNFEPETAPLSSLRQ